MTLQVWRSLADVPLDGLRSAVTLGNFDGVHRGHQAVLGRMSSEAEDLGLRSVAITFDPHPLAVHRPQNPPTLIAGIEDRLERIGEAGVAAVLLVEYTLEFAHQSAEEFVRDYLVDGLRAARVVIGHDTKFGWGNEGHAETMRELGERYGFEVEVLDFEGTGLDGGRRWSSTWVRELLEVGDVTRAAEVLGRPHCLRGEVIHGDALGRTIGFPTANLEVYAGMIPAHGVYAAWFTVVEPGVSTDGAALVGKPLPAAVSVGINSTVGGTTLRVEAHLIGLPDQDLYGVRARLDFVDRRRDMADFGSIEALTVALAEDVVWCREVLGLG